MIQIDGANQNEDVICAVFPNFQVHSHSGSELWWEDDRPKNLTVEGRNDHFDYTSRLQDVMEKIGFGRNGEFVTEERIAEMKEVLKLPDDYIYEKELQSRFESGELQA